METPIKRFKFNYSAEDVLNLSMTAHKPCPNPSNNIENMAEMKEQFQKWVVETYKDSSKTKTITKKKYERIIKTLAGEIKNCAENSKFRFWMKCKGFKLETQPNGEEILIVQDKKGDEMKYKKVAVVENFFDIIYNVHVNEGARGVQHAGQKRTHRTITETYAFLPREAVTKFLLFCSECQKRGHDERKCSPNSLSNDSFYDHSSPTAADRSNSKVHLIDTPLNFSTCHDETDRTKAGHLFEAVDKNCLETNDGDGREQQKMQEPNRRKKRKFIRKIIRPPIDSVNFQLTNLECGNAEKLASPLNLTQNDCNTSPRNDGKFSSSGFPVRDRIQFRKCDRTTEFQPNFRTQFVPPIFMQNCPYITKLANMLHDPAQFADCYFNEGTCSSEDYEFMEQMAVGLIMKVRHLEEEKDSLTEDEKHQLSLKVHSCRISSFLLNYAADLILKSLILH